MSNMVFVFGFGRDVGAIAKFDVGLPKIEVPVAPPGGVWSRISTKMPTSGVVRRVVKRRVVTGGPLLTALLWQPFWRPIRPDFQPCH